MTIKSILTFFMIAFTNFSSAIDAINLNGVEVKNINSINPSIVTAGQPSKEALNQLAEKGIKTVINLRTEGEFEEFNESELVQSTSMTYIHLPISGASDINLENAKKLDTLLNSAQTPVLVHCASSNRVGALFALRAALLQGKTLQEAMSIGESTGLGSLKKHTQNIILSAQK